MLLVYNLLISLYVALMYVASWLHPKARLWVKGRQNWRARLRTSVADWQKVPGVFWVHAASLGEFEQGRPVIEAFRQEFPGWKIVLTFYSPSGYEIRKNYAYADLICYLPADTQANARDFLDILNPAIAVFVKYEFWANYLHALKKRQTSTLLISAIFRPGQPFFAWYGAFWRNMLGAFEHLFVQDTASKSLLHGIGIQQVTVAGDTRVDRVLSIARQVQENPVVAPFVDKAESVLVVGSSWQPDEEILFPAVQASHIAKVLIAPHEPSPTNVTRICKQLEVYGVTRYSDGSGARARWMVINNVGMLNTLYRYGHIAYIGGGLGKGIHNTLEPAAFGLPVIFGPKYRKFEEARQFVARGGAFVVQNSQELTEVLKQLENKEFYQKASRAVLSYLEENSGATEKVMGFIRRVA
ncbi:MAG: 3-deoxy-D-manno-octulosonic acid transferase [Chitinophagales bacterium]|nr:3-deoxy-D-manno-octulosonic acid transferase [Chitinophagales bacterium]